MNEHTIEGRRHLLLAVEESEGSRQAVRYVADLFGSIPNIHVTVLSILPEPPEDDPVQHDLMEHQRSTREAALAEYREVLIVGGFCEHCITTNLIVRRYTSLGDIILEERERLGCSLVAIGRRGLSHHEEFLFGSTSSRILHNARNCAVLVVE